MRDGGAYGCAVPRAYANLNPGLVKGRSTRTNLLECVNDWTLAATKLRLGSYACMCETRIGSARQFYRPCSSLLL